MQALGTVTYADLNTPLQELLYKLEIYDGATWWDLSNLHEALIDGGLEDWASATNLTSWIEGVVGTSTVNRDAAEVHGGLYSVRLDISAGNDYAAIQQSDVPLKRPLNYCLSGWYKTEAGKTAQLELINSGVADIYLKEDGTWTTDVTFIHLAAATTWTYFAYYFTPHPSYTLYNVAFLRYSAASSSIWFDDLSISACPSYYLKELSFAQGGAGITPDPIEGTWSATVKNDDGIFHPRHPTSEFVDLLRVGRKVRLSVGALYNGVAKYWQRMVGYMDAPKFQAATKTIALTGGDSMKPLTDACLLFPDNYWGGLATFDSVSSTGTSGDEEYDESDALTPGAGEVNGAPAWTPNDCTFLSYADVGGGSSYVGRLIVTDATEPYVEDAVVGSFVGGVVYLCRMKYKRVIGTAQGELFMTQFSGGGDVIIGDSNILTSDAWVEMSFLFVPILTGAVKLRFELVGGFAVADEWRIDEFSMKIYEPAWFRYTLPAGGNGPHYVTLDGEPVWQGERDENGHFNGWLYDEDHLLFCFDELRLVNSGTANLLIYYYTDQVLENVVADILANGPDDLGGGVGLYATRAAALAAMDYVATGITLKRVWFDPGTSVLDAIRQLCERANYRFWFDEAGVPHFKPAFTHGDAVAWFSTKTCSDAGEFQDLEEIRNRISIEGVERAMYAFREDRTKSRFTGTASDAASIAAYLEKTHPIVNRLFQDQASIDARVIALLAEFKDPKLYSDLRVPKNPIPLERGDTIEWDIELRPPTTPGGTDGLKNTVRGIIRDASFSGDGFNYKCELRSTAMNVANYATGPVTVTAEHCKGWMLTNAGAAGDVQFNLPAAVIGMEITLYVLAAQTLTAHPNGTDHIAVLTDTAGDYLRSDAVIGSYLKLACLAAGHWHKADISGTWTEE